MQLVDAWRLFGPNLQTRGPAALVEVAFDAGEDATTAFGVWRQELIRLAFELGLPVVDPAARVYRGGAVLTFSAAIDVLLAATDAAEWAAQSAVSILHGGAALPLEQIRTTLRETIAASTNPRLVALEAEASKRGLGFLWDEAAVTLGAGRSKQVWPLTSLPRVDEVTWESLERIPIALVTGTNGKTTSVRLLARLLSLSGHSVGMTTTDGVWIGDKCVESGDYTGPAGATEVLGSTTIDAAVLETARGGILRRGVVVRSPQVALITNVSDDHLGHYGIDTLEALARVKAVVGAVVPPSGRVVVNADDPHVMAEARGFVAPLVLFSLDGKSPAVAAHVEKGGEAWTVREGWIVRLDALGETRLTLARELPIAFEGAAVYNVANALGAAASARALGVSDDNLIAGLRTFTSSASDNPGRGNLSNVGGVQVLVDFAHNPAGIRNVLALVSRLKPASGRLAVVAGYAGDRSNESIDEAAQAIFDARPGRIILRDLAGYSRGRAAGEVPSLFLEALLRRGTAKEIVDVAPSESIALRRALDWADAKLGDFVLVLAHLESTEVAAVLEDARQRATLAEP